MSKARLNNIIKEFGYDPGVNFNPNILQDALKEELTPEEQEEFDEFIRSTKNPDAIAEWLGEKADVSKLIYSYQIHASVEAGVKVYQLVRRLAQKNSRLLELGCANGWFLEYLSSAGAGVKTFVGIDRNIHFTNETLEYPTYSYELHSATYEAYQSDEPFDFVVSIFGVKPAVVSYEVLNSGIYLNDNPAYREEAHKKFASVLANLDNLTKKDSYFMISEGFEHGKDFLQLIYAFGRHGWKLLVKDSEVLRVPLPSNQAVVELIHVMVFKKTDEVEEFNSKVEEKYLRVYERRYYKM
ncbi:class I SAM-dependent methyltransferase [Pontibacter harenae]|uniref:class I SAM-dependent methyltransferase n=1 Tax=Pontibacter harenae TaxID=2894083 RepID=UPI001E3B7CF2|nr:class I SAM-dependent methyltransferase [Pontibacter harenae]MCC9168135.1 class I SAM-dependent methyltransferase [Pontibacter harenae]